VLGKEMCDMPCIEDYVKGNIGVSRKENKWKYQKKSQEQRNKVQTQRVIVWRVFEDNLP
jgi:hypothetical protein